MTVSTIVVCSLIVVGTFLCWEMVAWLTHKYVMHGFLWTWHKSHHSVHDHTLEANDWFAVIFSLPSIGLFYYFGRVHYNPYMLSVSVGILCYGIFYVIFHDIIVHQRIRWRPAKRSKYLQRMINAHYAHHTRRTKDGCEAFGFLFARRKYQPKATDIRKHEKRK